ncbi:MAG: hypothetical protein CSA38_03440 [Flavobacteriales bacterium]|nr:MAG: hypothetical protein CSA38_03440 [Flavobacteriales bacterium]
MKKLILSLILCLGFCFPMKGQDQENKVFLKVEEVAKFPGGIKAFRESIINEFDVAKIKVNEKILRTIIKFVIEKNGRISNVHAVGGNDEFKKEAVRVIKTIRKRWVPAKINGKSVRSVYKMPITIQMPKEDLLLYETVDEVAKFPGGIDAFRNIIFNELTGFKSKEKEEVLIVFVIEKNGNLTDVQLIGGSDKFREEILNVIYSIDEKWIPAKVKGEYVSSLYKLPIVLR